MTEIKIRLITVEDVKSFVREAENQQFDIDLYDSKHCVDGKSILGIFSLYLMDNLRCVMTADEDTAKSFIDSIRQYVI